jgi:hypothetical protein
MELSESILLHVRYWDDSGMKKLRKFGRKQLQCNPGIITAFARRKPGNTGTQTVVSSLECYHIPFSAYL